MQTPDYYGNYYRLREDIILPPTPIYHGGYTKRDSLYTTRNEMDGMDTDPVPPTRGRLATALRWTAYGVRYGLARHGIHSDVHMCGG